MVRTSKIQALVFVGGILVLPQLFAAENQALPTEQDVAMLEKAVLSGDRAAVQAAFRLRLRADGAVAESVDIVLGSIIESHPRLFLQELQRSGNFVRLDSLLGNLGPKYVDRMKAQSRELGKRAAALRKVSDPAVRETRDRCIIQLRGMETRSLSNNTLERTVGHRGPRLAAARSSRPAAQLGR
jgi:hypothetical protein